jgi:protein tyrosine phosphatase (PTP) superfamily phosphohydrolase (DUF442 family)
MTRLFGLFALAGLLVASAGCTSTCERRPLCRRKDPPPAKPVFLAPQPLPQGAPIQQSGGFPVLPPGAVVNPPPGAKVAPSISNLPERPNTQWQPSERLDPDPKKDAPPSIKLYAPEPIDKGADKDPKKDAPPSIKLYAPDPVDKDSNKEPPPDKKPSAQGGFPAIAQFAEARKNVYAGLRPSLDGLDWLHDHGVQTIVQVRLFGEDDAADKKQVEKRGMTYVAFEVSPEALSREKADEFVKLIREQGRQGIFVYDQDGSLAGSMWYLQQRLGDFVDDEAARLNARQLGLQTDRAGQHRDMWLAARKLADENSK